FKAFTDDTFIKAAGTRERPITVSIHDVAINLKQHKGIWWENAAMFGVKIYHANKVDICRVNSYADNAIFTNFDLRVCSNITFKNCNITNYNNCMAGGNLWIRGEACNVYIADNTFRKYGNDEIFGIFEATVDAHTNRLAHVARENISVSNNKFIYGSEDGRCDIFNDVLVSFNTAGGNITAKNYGCHNKYVAFTNNRFEINSLCRKTLNIGFSEEDTQEDISIVGNEFENNRVDTDEKYYHQDIFIIDKSQKRTPVYFCANTINNHMPVVNKFGTTGNAIALLRGGNIQMEDNVINDHAPSSPLANEELGTTLLWCGEQGGKATLIGNEATGMKLLATVSDGAGIDSFTIIAYDNRFEGDTRIYCNKVRRLNLLFNRNTFFSSNMNFFLQEFATEGALVFKNNEVHAQNGQLMTHWSSTPTSAMRFNTLEVTGNTFYGTKGEKDVLRNITNVKHRDVSGNIYYQR
ncbi:MAG: hypothetical protein MR928_04605, partial [Bacteroidales bacterium]|nr:hypothetical protein [Bacteroidales bacterium]